MLSHATVMESPLLQRAYGHLMVLEFDSDQTADCPHGPTWWRLWRVTAAPLVLDYA